MTEDTGSEPMHFSFSKENIIKNGKQSACIAEAIVNSRKLSEGLEEDKLHCKDLAPKLTEHLCSLNELEAACHVVATLMSALKVHGGVSEECIRAIEGVAIYWNTALLDHSGRRLPRGFPNPYISMSMVPSIFSTVLGMQDDMYDAFNLNKVFSHTVIPVCFNATFGRHGKDRDSMIEIETPIDKAMRFLADHREGFEGEDD